MAEFHPDDVRCRGCNQPAVSIRSAYKNRTRVGIIHRPNCWYLRWLNRRFPILMSRIEKEREWDRAVA